MINFAFVEDAGWFRRDGSICVLIAINGSPRFASEVDLNVFIICNLSGETWVKLLVSSINC